MIKAPNSTTTQAARLEFRVSAPMPSATFAMGSALAKPTFSSADSGMSIVATAANDPDFPPIAALLTDGAESWIDIELFTVGGNAGLGETEQGLLQWMVTGGPDLAGYPVGSITMTLDSIDYRPDHYDAGMEGWYNCLSVQASFVIEDVPEPTTSAFLALGGLAVLRRRRKA